MTNFPISGAMQSIVVQAPIEENNHVAKIEADVCSSRSSHLEPVLISPAAAPLLNPHDQKRRHRLPPNEVARTTCAPPK
jgi:hypothetical protein